MELTNSQNQSLDLVKKEIVIAMAVLNEANIDAELVYKLINEIEHLTEHEKSFAIKSGYHGKYGQCFKLTPHSFLYWINCFENDKREIKNQLTN